MNGTFQALRAVANARQIFPPETGTISLASINRARRDYERGDYFFPSLLFSSILEQDAQVATCAEKRFAKTLALDWEVVPETGANEEEAKKQQALILDLLNSLSFKFVDGIQQELGFQGFLRFLLSAIPYGFAVATRDFENALADGVPTVHATLLGCRHSFFERLDGVLRLRETFSDYRGNTLNPDDWLVAQYHAPLMLSTLLPVLQKTATLQDWCSTVEKFGVPFVLAKTPAEIGTSEWTQAENAVKNIGSGFAGVVGTDVEIQTNSLAQGDAPHERLVDYSDRQISRLWLGGDLETMSREGDSVGSLSQTGTATAIETADRRFVENTVDAQLVQPFLRAIGQKQLAFFKFSVREQKDVNASIARLQMAQALALPVPRSFVYAELGIPQPQAGEPTIFDAPAQGIPQPAQQEQAQEGAQDETANALAFPDFSQANNAQFRELQERLAILETIEDDDDFQRELEALSRDFPAIKNKILNRNTLADFLQNEIRNSISG